MKKTMLLDLHLIVGLLVGCSANSIGTQSVSYEPAIVQLTGRVGFEGAWILKLDRPISIKAKVSGDTPDSEEHNQAEVQIIAPKSVGMSKFKDRHVTVRGTISHAVNIHHMRSLLLDVETIVQSRE